MQNKICPSLWFSDISVDITEIVDYYQVIFGNHFTVNQVLSSPLNITLYPKQ